MIIKVLIIVRGRVQSGQIYFCLSDNQPANRHAQSRQPCKYMIVWFIQWIDQPPYIQWSKAIHINSPADQYKIEQSSFYRKNYINCIIPIKTYNTYFIWERQGQQTRSACHRDGEGEFMRTMDEKWTWCLLDCVCQNMELYLVLNLSAGSKASLLM